MKFIHNTRFINGLLSLGILSSILYIATDVAAVAYWYDYSYSSQTVSELFAIDAPTRFFVVPLFAVYAITIYLFGFGIWLSSENRKYLKIAAILIIGKEVLGLYATIYAPIHLRGDPATISDTVHAVITAAGVFLFMFPAMGFGAASFGSKFKIYSIITMFSFILFGVLTGLQGEALAENRPTPLMGITERINIYGYMLWIIILALNIIRAKK